MKAMLAPILLLGIGLSAAEGVRGSSRSICSEIPKPSAPCVECSLAVDQPEQLNNLPPLYWDVCADAGTATPLLYFLPKSIAVVNKDGKLQQSMRLRNGELFLTANLSYQPWGAGNDLNQALPLQFLKKNHPGIRFALAPQTNIDTKLKGQWQQWVKSIYLTPVTGVDSFQTMRLEVTFKKEFETLVKHSMARPLGLLGSVTMTFKAYNAQGQLIEGRHTMALHVGGVTVRP